MAGELKKLSNRRNIPVSRITEVFNLAKKALTNEHVQSLFKARYQDLDSNYSEFKEIHNKVIGLLGDDDDDFVAQDVIRRQVDELYYETKSIYNGLFFETNTNFSSQNSANVNVKLPKISIPTFDGNLQTWPTFFDLFVSLIHDNPNLSKIEKFQYLVSFLSGEPFDLIKSIKRTDSNYETAFGTLKNRYQNVRLLATTYWNAIQSAPFLKTNNFKDLRKLIDTFTQNIEALTLLKFPCDKWGFIFFNLLLQKLDSTTRTGFEMKYSEVDLPTYENLLDFLNQHCKALESMQCMPSSSCKPAKYPANNSPKSGNNNYSQHNLQKPFSLATQTPSAPSNQFSSKCKLCKKDSHLLSQCELFTSKSPADRFSYVKQNHLCINCLRSSHMLKDCPSTFSCRTCRSRHHSMLHFSTQPSGSLQNVRPVSELENNPQNNPEIVSISNPPLNASMTAPLPDQRSMILLSTLRVEILNARGHYQPVRVLLDSASQANFISESCANRLGLSRENFTVPIMGLNNASSTSKGKAYCTIRPEGKTEPKFSFEALVLPTLCTNLPSTKIDTSFWSHIINLEMADKHFDTPASVDLLIGAELYPLILKSGRRMGNNGQPCALETVFGWILLGKVETTIQNPNISSYSTILQCSLESDIRRFWELESVSNKPLSSPDDNKCEKIFRSSLNRDPQGRFVVSLPFRNSEPNLGDTYSLAYRRFMYLESRLTKNPALYSAYKKFMCDYLNNGHMSLIAADNPKPNLSCYIPHHCVVSHANTTFKIRVVFDCSAKGSNGISLNDTLLCGPKLQNDLNRIILKFRYHPIVFIADIKQMFLQILVSPKFRDFQRILWRFDSKEPLQEYFLNTVIFGMTSSPFLAIRVLKELAIIEESRFPEASQVLLHDTFVDDVISGSSTVEGAMSLQNDLIKLLGLGGFELKKWASNCPELLSKFSTEECQMPLSFDKEEPISVKVLGMQWDPKSDEFFFSYSSSNRPCTKRNILSDIARIFDPMGYISPVSFLAKHIMQRLWISKTDWDETPEDAIVELWNKFKNELPSLSEISLPRHVFSGNIACCEFHGFSDASERGYAAAVYVRIGIADNSFKSFLLMGKSKVSPLKTISLPKLELCGAVLLSNLLSFIIEVYSKFIVIKKVSAYSDSKIVLAWIASSPHRWKTFVANRVSHIQNIIPQVSWHHVLSHDNPVDCASRGLTPKNLIRHHLWFHGPSWLVLPDSEWNLSEELFNTSDEERPLALAQIAVQPNCLDELLQNVSSLQKIQRIISYCLRVFRNFRDKNHNRIRNIGLSPFELQESLLVLVRHVQNMHFSDIKHQIQSNELLPKPFRQICPFLDKAGLLRVGGRLRHSELSFESKHPLLLPRNCRLSELLIEKVHKEYLHPGLNTVLYLIRQQFWIMSARRAINHVLSRCIRCFRLRPKTYTPYMGDIPSFRISQLKAFSHASIDYAGPFIITMGKYRGAKTSKAYICIFVCCSTKAIHIELASDLTSDAFIAALRRFVARRGRCSNLYSDCGTNFIGAFNELQGYCKDSSELSNINWHFNPPAAPHFNGLSEAGVKSVKSHLYRVIGEQILTYEELYTLLSQIESTLNSRPLYPQSSDPNDLEPLSPGHFLTMEPLNSCPDPDLSHLKLNTLSRWQLIQRLHVDFWKRWHVEYLNNLQQRAKWSKKPHEIKVNTLVLIKNETKTPLQWLLGRIVELHPGSDGHVRVVTLKTKNGLLRRPIVKLCPLPIN